MILGALWSVISMIAPAGTGLISFVPEVIIKNETLYLGEIIDAGALPLELRDRAAKLPLMKLPKNSNALTLRTSDIESRARSIMPALAPWFKKTNGTVLILRHKDDPMRLLASATHEGGIVKGDATRVTIVAGIYTIERQGIAMSDAKAGERLFVKTEDRKALSAICCGK